MSRDRPRSAASRSRSQIAVKDKKIGSIFHVRSITLSFLDGFRNYFAEIIIIMMWWAQDPGL